MRYEYAPLYSTQLTFALIVGVKITISDSEGAQDLLSSGTLCVPISDTVRDLETCAQYCQEEMTTDLQSAVLDRLFFEECW
jgi:hypothetical protein